MKTIQNECGHIQMRVLYVINLMNKTSEEPAMQRKLEKLANGHEGNGRTRF